MDKFLSQVDSVIKKLGRCVIAASEGICDTDGVTWAEKLAEQKETDAEHEKERLEAKEQRAKDRRKDTVARQIEKMQFELDELNEEPDKSIPSLASPRPIEEINEEQIRKDEEEMMKLSGLDTLPKTGSV